ncbi:MAG: M3 family oligoendopeptidase [Candidatus Hodarchaeales archaeon]
MTTKWDLSFIYKGYDDPKIDEDMDQADRLADDLAKYRNKIKTGEMTTSKLNNLFKQLEKISTLITRAGAYGVLLFYQETSNENYKGLYSKVDQKAVDISNKLIWVKLEINETPENVIEKYIQDPGLANYHHYIQVQRLSKPYLLSEPEEKILAQKVLVGRDAWEKFYEEFTSAFQFNVEIEGEMKTFSPEEIRTLFVDPNPETREKVFRAYYQKYADESTVMYHVFNNIWKNHGQDVNLRKYPSPMTPAHIRNQTEEKIVETMMDVIRKNYSFVEDYYKAKAKLMGQGDKIKGSDLYAPVGKIIKYSWDEAKTLVLNAYSEFDSEIGEMARSFFERNLIDSEIRPTKRGGAYCMPISPGLDPVLHMNFDGTPSSIRALAHELGHGLHSMLSGRKQTMFNFRAATVAAETASVFGEQILIDKLLKTMTDKEAKIQLLNSRLEDAILTMSRQTMYVFWEKECHEKGAKTNLKNIEMSDIWDAKVKEMYGEAVEFLPEQSWNWATIPHFLDNRVFYCYAYSFGMLFVLGLYQKFLEEGEAFIPKYKNLLGSGGSKFPVDLADSIGLDLTKPEFWQAGFDYLKKLVAEFQEVIEQGK